jgi:cytochrome P450
VATEDITLGGQTIRAGEAVMASICSAICSAHRDKTVLTDPDRLDFGRPNNQHLNFGYGTHFCLGAHLARAELELAFRTLLRRLPKLCLAVPQERLTWFMTSVTRSVESLPVIW